MVRGWKLTLALCLITHFISRLVYHNIQPSSLVLSIIPGSNRILKGKIKTQNKDATHYILQRAGMQWLLDSVWAAVPIKVGASPWGAEPSEEASHGLQVP